MIVFWREYFLESTHARTSAHMHTGPSTHTNTHWWSFFCLFVCFWKSFSSFKSPSLEFLFSIFLMVCVLVTQLCLTLCDSMDYIAHQAPLSMEFSRQEYHCGLSFPSPGDFLNSGIKPSFQQSRQILYWQSHQGSPLMELNIKTFLTAFEIVFSQNQYLWGLLLLLFGWFYLKLWCVVVLVTQSCPTLCNSMDRQSPLSVGLSWKEYWSGLPFPLPEDLFDPGIEPESPA